MRSYVWAAVVAGTVGAGFLASTWAEEAKAPATATAPSTQAGLNTQQEKVSYILGLQVGSQIKDATPNLDVAQLMKGIEDGRAAKYNKSYIQGLRVGSEMTENDGKIDAAAATKGIRDGIAEKPAMDREEMHKVVQAYQTEMQAKQMEKAHAEAAKNKKEGDAFLADNGKKEGVKTTASGLQYKVLASGKGKTPKATDTVAVNYKGTFINGTQFDASKGAPVEFPADGVIAGWTEALTMMKEGDKWMLYVPAKLAYGDMGRPGIPPSSTLVFEVELVEVKPEKK